MNRQPLGSCSVEDDGFSFLYGVEDTFHLNGGDNNVAKYGRIQAHHLDLGVVGLARVHSETEVGLPLRPQVLPLCTRGEHLRMGIEDEACIGGKKVEIGHCVVCTKRCDKASRGFHNLGAGIGVHRKTLFASTLALGPTVGDPGEVWP